MPIISWQRRRTHSEHAAAIEHEINQAAAERRRVRKIPILGKPQSRSFDTDAAAKAFATMLRAQNPDVAITVTPDRPKSSSPVQGRLDEVSDELWPIQWPVAE